MGSVTIKLSDVGEGVAEAELVEWHVAIGDVVREDTVLAAVMTDKATVDIPAPVDGTVEWLGGEIGETIAVGAPLVRLAVAGGEGDAVVAAAAAPHAEPQAPEPEPEAEDRAETGDAAPQAAPAPRPASPRSGAARSDLGAPRKSGERPLASPSVRRRAMDAGVDLRRVPGSGPAGRIGHDDLDAYLAGGVGSAGPGRLAADNSISEVKIVGLRRRIAEKMALATRRIAHITYVEEIDVEALEELRAALNRDRRDDRPKLTLLPFLMRAMVIAIRDQPLMNAHYDDEANVLRQHGGVHVGVAAQTGGGLVVPVVRHAEARDVWGCAEEVARLSEMAKTGRAKREELSGSTITITSLGALGGIVTTPVINHPEVAIVGVNKIEMRPVWDGARFVPRRRMNLSSSFDHRVVDGYDAAVFVQRIKALLETPAMIFAES
ncbi:dihydrolipoamide acetyltransferase family protein [Aurantimonas endophytica]|uniref:Dihydrolipoamide acetyltransferase component of pyruvate dehydrogenase complex n=1 Tax=Aurantimonas endophytica TaxID=1522175 RepID=A0A7W6HHS0_9HYPH|nr:dihydrolipoamide acetyltransferase family protein [Aurantimonas endophytica]MBB4005426.1 2-oxoisovalerate dehydrogenase E2 component (dihydrolipoyl transacylase) [Aurantimonas endophytica]MCO6405918.1 2-oxo acid dehydrogenase subunit E2 [Aurantimonas endophytica]